MSAGTSEFFCLICLLVCSCTAQKIITAELGKNVILPCKDPHIKNINDITALGWKKSELDSEYVLLYRNKGFDPDSQHRSYKNRVDLQDKEMKDGNVSLILKNVTMEDTGTYVCRVSQKGKTEPISTIILKVYLSVQEITADLGQDVTLPCKVPNNNINDITAVEWNRPGLDPDHVLLYRNKRLDPDNQHPSYQNRVDLQDKEMKDGDVSLILKNVKKEDTGTYECQVFEKGKNELISIINLEVLPPDHSWKIKVGVVVTLVVIILSAVGFAVNKILQIWKRKTLENEIQKDIEQLKRNNPEINNQLQQEEQENEALKNEQEELKRGHSDITSELQQEKLKNEALESRLKKKLKRGHSDASIELQLEKQKNEALMNHLMKLAGPIIVEGIDKYGRFIRLQNVSSEGIKLKGWKLELQRNSETVTYTFNESLRLQPGRILTMGSELCSTDPDHVNVRWPELQNWNLGDKLQINLISNKGENFKLRSCE